MKKKSLRKLLALLLVFVIIELLLRMVGFGELPIYYSSAHFEYALRPSQDVHRFGNHFYINEKGMRSANLEEGELRILKFGDSVLNGGLATDQDDLASTLLDEKLGGANNAVRVLNISAGSWGPDNAFAWLEQNGDFEARAIVLLFSSHDWLDLMTFQDVVGHVEFYPERQPALAITDAFGWMLSRYITDTDWSGLPSIAGGNPVQADHNLGWDAFIDYAKARAIPLIVYHHTALDEIGQGSWSSEGVALEAFLSMRKIKTVSGFDAGFVAVDYRDAIHPNASGQQKIADALEPFLTEIIEND